MLAWCHSVGIDTVAGFGAGCLCLALTVLACGEQNGHLPESVGVGGASAAGQPATGGSSGAPAGAGAGGSMTGGVSAAANGGSAGAASGAGGTAGASAD